MYKLGWFSTGRGSGSRSLLQAIQESINLDEIDAEIAFVFCSREPGETEATDTFLKMVNDYQIPLVCFSYQKFKAKLCRLSAGNDEILPQWRLDYDRKVMARLQGFHPNLCVLAGYMLIVGKEMCQRYDMVNLHPATPWGPTGTWREIIWHLIENNAQETGVMMHLVTPNLDRGPPVTYCTFPIRGSQFDKYWDEISTKSITKIKQSQGENNALFKRIREFGFAREIPLIKSTVKVFSQGKVKVASNEKITEADGRLIKGYDLTSEINELLKDDYRNKLHS